MAFVLLLIMFLPWRETLAYRPFESTDADVVDREELEIEWGMLTFEHQDDKTTYIVPDLVFNLGLTDRTEIVGEFTTERTLDDKWELADPGTFVKTVWRQGVLQGSSGVSIATELGALLPGTTPEEDGIGAEGIVIASTQLSAVTLHINLGGGITRTGSDAFALAGLIAEYPISHVVRVVGEVSGEVVAGEDPEGSILFGAIMTPDWFNGKMDFGVRRGLTQEAIDWTFTFGVTVPFQLLSNQ